MVTFNAALTAYNNAAKIASTGIMGENTEQVNSPSFASAINESLNNSISTLKKVDHTVAKSLVNQADITDVVTAITNAELTLKTVIEVRDRLVAAHQEVMKMPI